MLRWLQYFANTLIAHSPDELSVISNILTPLRIQEAKILYLVSVTESMTPATASSSNDGLFRNFNRQTPSPILSFASAFGGLSDRW
jgi:hypothetical protein